MLWVLPINLPVLVVWIRNLAVHWLTPFSSHHNILSIMPYILLVETLSTGRMIPTVQAPSRYITEGLLLGLAACAAIYGVSYAYYLHHVVNVFCGWLVILHWSTSSFPFYRSVAETYVEQHGVPEKTTIAHAPAPATATTDPPRDPPSKRKKRP